MVDTMATHPTSTSRSQMLQRLTAAGPLPEYADKLMLFGQLVGSWDIEARFFDADGNVTREARGEWHFDWVLEGRGIQDVLISPPVEQRGEPDSPPGEYGTTVRLYDPKLDAWHVTWNAPVYGGNVQLVARQVGGDIVLEGHGRNNNPYNWVFSEITERSFLWRGYESHDEGKSWLFDEEMRARRRESPKS
jgi:hypothetical protein